MVGLSPFPSMRSVATRWRSRTWPASFSRTASISFLCTSSAAKSTIEERLKCGRAERNDLLAVKTVITYASSQLNRGGPERRPLTTACSKHRAIPGRPQGVWPCSPGLVTLRSSHLVPSPVDTSRSRLSPFVQSDWTRNAGDLVLSVFIMPGVTVPTNASTLQYHRASAA